ncbi:TPA: hypothetical protein F3L15_04480 [Aeromonas hydrophila]|nr:hypothetical protein [Aeromonas hydrophila]
MRQQKASRLFSRLFIGKESLMTMWTGIVLIVFISALFGFLSKRARYQLGDIRITDRLGKQDVLISQLQERIANLEAIVIEEEKRRPFKEL